MNAVLELDSRALEDLVFRAFGQGPSVVTPMPGGASTRRYLRVVAGGVTAVAMFVPDSAPEEVTNPAHEPRRWPFLEVQELLSAREIRVPRVLAEDCNAGLVLLEDLGDVTLGAFLLEAPLSRETIYRRAVQDLARAQKALADIPPSSVIASRAFDETLLRWELDHFREFCLDARGMSLAPADRATFDAIADRLARRIASWPRGFVHRDYQSRNLMVVQGAPDPDSDEPNERPSQSGDEPELVWIDFQDALMGPRVYDLVALLNDSYQSFDRSFVDARLDDFAAASGMTPEDRAALGREFDVVTVQRKLKDAGRFVFIDRVKKNPSFLPFIEPSLAKVRGSLERLADEEDMRVLAELIRTA